MADMRKKEEEEKEKKKAAGGKSTESYSGGASSGMAVQSGENDDDLWKKMQENASSSGPAPDAYQITLWRDGFTINDGPLRPLSDPLNKKFVDEIQRGQCPDELKGAATGDVPVSVHDKRSEEYKE